MIDTKIAVVKQRHGILAKNPTAMNPKLVFAKTPTGDEAVRQSTRVVQRNLRMVLVQVDGKLSVEELAAKIGDARLVDNALRELEEGGFIAPALEAMSAWKQSQLGSGKSKAGAAQQPPQNAAWDPSSSQFASGESTASTFSSFGKPVPPVKVPVPRAPEPVVAEPVFVEDEPAIRRPVGKLVGLAVTLLVVIAAAVVLLYPYDRFKPDIEAELSRIVNAKVQVGDVRVRMAPFPVLRIVDVRIGEGGGQVVDEIRVPSAFSLLGGGPRRVERVELVGGQVAADQLLAMPMWGAQVAGGATQLGVRTISVDRVSVTAGSMRLGELAGELNIAADGKLEKAALQTMDGTLRVSAVPGQDGIQVGLEGLGWRPTQESPLTLDSLQAKAVLQPGKLSVRSFEATAMGGTARGSWVIDWGRGLAMNGEATLERMEMKRVSAVFVSSLQLEGTMSGSFRLRGLGRDWDPMWRNAEAYLDATIVRGVLNGVDLGEAARRGYGSMVRSGSTRFDRLNVKVSVEPARVVGRDLSLNAGMFSATGHFVSNRERQVDSNLLVTMQTSVSSLTLPVKVSGILPNLQASVSR